MLKIRIGCLLLLSIFIGKEVFGKSMFRKPSGRVAKNSTSDYDDEEVETAGSGRPGAEKLSLDKDEEITKPPDYEKTIAEALKDPSKPDNFTEDAVDGNKGKAGIGDDHFRWNYEMKIQIDPKFPKEMRKKINAAIWTVRENMKCFKFVVVHHKKKMKSNEDYLYIKWESSSQGACNSGVGRWGGKVMMRITNGCQSLYGATMHELLHALGFFHEHNRFDRDKYVTINWKELSRAGKGAWEIPEDQIVYTDKYDFDSIMHYPFGRIMQATAKVPSGVRVGQHTHLSEGDKNRIKKMYPCDRNDKPITTEKPTIMELLDKHIHFITVTRPDGTQTRIDSGPELEKYKALLAKDPNTIKRFT